MQISIEGFCLNSHYGFFHFKMAKIKEPVSFFVEVFCSIAGVQ